MENSIHSKDDLTPSLLNTDSLSKPTLIRSQSAQIFPSKLSTSITDWRSFTAIEERAGVREKIKEEYSKNCVSYDELLQICSAIDEELIHSLASNRIDYFKHALQWSNRIQIKRKQLAGQSGVSLFQNNKNENEPDSKKRKCTP